VFVTEENNPFAIKQPSLIAKNRKKMFYKEKSLVGLTPLREILPLTGLNLSKFP
jgi:hypothetical protein